MQGGGQNSPPFGVLRSAAELWGIPPATRWRGASPSGGDIRQFRVRTNLHREPHPSMGTPRHNRCGGQSSSPVGPSNVTAPWGRQARDDEECAERTKLRAEHPAMRCVPRSVCGGTARGALQRRGWDQSHGAAQQRRFPLHRGRGAGLPRATRIRQRGNGRLASLPRPSGGVGGMGAGPASDGASTRTSSTAPGIGRHRRRRRARRVAWSLAAAEASAAPAAVAATAEPPPPPLRCVEGRRRRRRRRQPPRGWQVARPPAHRPSTSSATAWQKRGERARAQQQSFRGCHLGGKALVGSFSSPTA